MKYGKYLKNNQIQKWEAHYLDYKRLKKLIKDSQAEAEKVFSEGTKIKFMPVVAEEMGKVVKFSLDTKTKLRLQFESIETQKTGDHSNELVTIYRELGLLLDFMKLNREGFRKILKKFDKKLKSSAGFGVFRQVDARFSSEIVDLTYIQETTLKFYISKYGPLLQEFLSNRTEDVFSFENDANVNV